MTKFIWIRLAIAGFFIVAILIGRWIDPEGLTDWANQMNAGKYVTVGAIVSGIGYFAYLFGKSLSKPKPENDRNPEDEN